MAFVHVKVALCKTLTIINCVCKACVIINSSEQKGLYLLGGFPGEKKFLGIFRSVWISREWGGENFCLKTQISGWRGQKAAVRQLKVTTPDPPGTAVLPAPAAPQGPAGCGLPAGPGLGPGPGCAPAPQRGGHGPTPAGAAQLGPSRPPAAVCRGRAARERRGRRAGPDPASSPARCRPGAVSACAAPGLGPRPRRKVVAEAGPARRLASPRLASLRWGRAGAGGGGGQAAPGGMIGTVLCYVLLPAARLLRALRGNPAPGGRRRGPAGAGCGSPSPPPAPARGGSGRRGPGGGEPGSCRLPRSPPPSPSPWAAGEAGWWGAWGCCPRWRGRLCRAGAAHPRGSAGGWVFGGNSRRLLCRSGRLQPAWRPEPPAAGLGRSLEMGCSSARYSPRTCR